MSGYAEDGLADGGLVQIAEPEVHVGPAVVLEADLFGLDGEALHAAVFNQLRPGGRRGGGRKFCLRADHRLEDADLLGHRAARGHHHLVLGDDGDGGAGNGIQADEVFFGT